MIVFYFLVSILPLAKHPLWGDRFGDMTVIKYVGLLSLAYAVVHFFIRPSSPQFLRTRTARAFLLFYGLVTLNYLAWGQEFSFAMDPFISYTSFLMFFVVTLILIDSLPRLRMAMLVVGSIALASVYLIREWLTPIPKLDRHAGRGVVSRFKAGKDVSMRRWGPDGPGPGHAGALARLGRVGGVRSLSPLTSATVAAASKSSSRPWRESLPFHGLVGSAATDRARLRGG